MKLNDFKILFTTIMKSLSKEDKNEVYDLLIPILKDERSDEDVLLEKLNTLCDFF
jgi:hypothetical protein